jgi:hypothetical protein
VNSDGTGAASVWPSETASCPAAAARQPPVASRIFSAEILSPPDKLN